MSEGNITMVNRAAVMTGLERMEIRERPMPAPRTGQAVVRVEAVGVCGSDVSYFRHGRVADYVVDGDIVLGHEAAGQVVAVAPDVDLAVGTRVAIEPGTPCRDCRECMAGRYHLCLSFVFLATPPDDGALVQFIAVDARQLFPIPDTMSYEQAALVEPLSVGLWACTRASLAPGDEVVVTGAGPVGILAAEAARALGARAVTVNDISDFRLGVAREHGFTTERSDAPGESQFDVLLECSGAPGVLASGLSRLREAGRAAVIGMAKDAIPLALSQLTPRELTISLVSRYRNTWPLGISLIETGRVNTSGLHTHSYPLTRTAEALTIGQSDPESLKVIVYPGR